ncbi:hypothetical protein ACIB24_04765 [Spongisporangium articulatum]|uniref:Uncharacterized protein n=1 Tax=Spongisporangium articulatum TaxID=3362603 RepID=A0ABW8AJ24_9ACTN
MTWLGRLVPGHRRRSMTERERIAYDAKKATRRLRKEAERFHNRPDANNGKDLLNDNVQAALRGGML